MLLNPNDPIKPLEPLPLELEKLGKKVLDAAFIVHTALGPGLLESVYAACLVYEIGNLGLRAETQVVVPVRYQDVYVETGLRLDLWVERQIIIELKTGPIDPLQQAQLLTYLKVTGCRLGYLMNFNVQHLKDGLHRIVN